MPTTKAHFAASRPTQFEDDQTLRPAGTDSTEFDQQLARYSNNVKANLADSSMDTRGLSTISSLASCCRPTIEPILRHPDWHMHRIALAIAKPPRPSAGEARNDADPSAPRTHIFDGAFSPVYDLGIVPGIGTRHVTPDWWRMGREVHRRGQEYDAVISWGEKLTLGLLAHQPLLRGKRRHIAMMYQFEKPNIRLPLKALKQHLHAVITWSSVQRRALIDDIGYPADRVYLVRHYVDQLFYSPRAVEADMICAVGAEMRDYVTFARAMRDTGIRCHIATDHVRVPGRIQIFNARRVPINAPHFATGPGLTQGKLPLSGLRDLYARSRFVVVPLLPSDTDNGITVILEAMAMGKAVICSKTRGQVDAIEDGKSGLYVPVGDAAAMREAIRYLWNNPLVAEQMGQRARAQVERHHSLEKFTRTVRSAAEASLGCEPAPDGHWDPSSTGIG